MRSAENSKINGSAYRTNSLSYPANLCRRRFHFFIFIFLSRLLEFMLFLQSSCIFMNWLVQLILEASGMAGEGGAYVVTEVLRLR